MNSAVLIFWLSLFKFNPASSHVFDYLNKLENIGRDENKQLLYTNYVAKIAETYSNSLYRVDSSLVEAVYDVNLRKCFVDYLRIANSLVHGRTWALQFIDASAKPPAGMSAGDITWPGSYEVCKRIRSDPADGEPVIRGRYCTLRIPIKINDPEVPIDIGVLMGICLPSDCTTADLHTLLNATFRIPNMKYEERFTYCHMEYDEMPKDKFFIFAVIVLSVVGSLVLIGSLLDLALYLKWQSAPAYGPLDQYEVSAVNGDSSYPPSISSAQSDEQGSPAFTGRLDAVSAYSDYRMEFFHKYLFCGGFLLVFSFPFNVYKLWSTQGPQIQDMHGRWRKHPLASLDGIRVITLTWIIYIHTVTFQTFYVDNPFIFMNRSYTDWSFQLARNGSFSVDTFFLISGLLSCYILIPNVQKRKGFCSKLGFWLHFAVHRFLRIVPSWFTVTIAFTGLFPYLTDGPFYPQNPEAQDELAACRQYWWVGLLNNWIHSEKTCMIWTWYLSNDYQFSVILVPIFATLVTLHWIAGLLFTIALVISAAVATFVITYQYEYGPSPLPPLSIAHLYSKPYTRWGSYAIGMLLGWMLQYCRTTGKDRPLWLRCCVNLGASAIAAFLTLTVLFGVSGRLYNKDHLMSNIEGSIYAALSRPTWCIGIAICIYLCAEEWSPIVNAILGFPGFHVLAKLTYCSYLVHPIIIIYYAFSRNQPADVDYSFLFFAFVGVWTLANALALIISMCTEVPVMAFESAMRNKPNRENNGRPR